MTDVLSVAEYRAVCRKPNKYRNVKVRCDGYTFDSKAEHRRYEELALLERHGLIAQLGIHPSFAIDVLGERICVYVADFSYIEVNGRPFVVEDVKGVRTPNYLLKKKLMLAVHGIEITEIS
jgi:hypothetical protein